MNNNDNSSGPEHQKYLDELILREGLMKNLIPPKKNASAALFGSNK